MSKIIGIKYIAPLLDNSGYAKAARGYVLALHRKGIPVTVTPISFEKFDVDLGDDGKIIRSLIDRDIDYNVVLIHTTPEFWSKYIELNKTNIGYTIWETTKLHPDWPNYINNTVDKVLVGCTWNVDVFKDSGVTKPIACIPHTIPIDDPSKAKTYKISGLDDDTYKFYSIFQWCYDDKTRVLTDKGLKYFNELEYTDRLATLNLETEELEYHEPDEIVSFDSKEPMYRLYNSDVDICVNLDHKLVVDEGSGYTLKPLREFTYVTPKGITKFTRSKKKLEAKLKNTCKWVGQELKYYELPKATVDENDNFIVDFVKVKTNEFLTFLAYYLGSSSFYLEDCSYKIALNFSNSVTSIDDVIGFLDSVKYKYDVEDDNLLVITDLGLLSYLDRYDLLNNKVILSWIKNLSSEQIKLFVKHMFKSVGGLDDSGKPKAFYTPDKRLAEDLVECLLKAGYAPRLKHMVKQKVLTYKVFTCESTEYVLNDVNLDELRYDGKIYCASVKNHNMFVERNGKMLFCGNTERKDPISLIKAYWLAFTNDPVANVALVLKTYRSDYSEQEKDAIRITLKRLKKLNVLDYYPPIYYISDKLSEDEMRGLHNECDCYVTLDRGEGFGLPAFTAGAYGNPVISTGFGGALEYLNEDNSYLVNYTLTMCGSMPWSPWYRGDQLWAQADVKHGSDLIRHVYYNQDEAKTKGLKLQNYIHDNFNEEVIVNRLIDEIEVVL